MFLPDYFWASTNLGHLKLDKVLDWTCSIFFMAIYFLLSKNTDGLVLIYVPNKRNTLIGILLLSIRNKSRFVFLFDCSSLWSTVLLVTITKLTLGWFRSQFLFDDVVWGDSLSEIWTLGTKGSSGNATSVLSYSIRMMKFLSHLWEIRKTATKLWEKIFLPLGFWSHKYVLILTHLGILVAIVSEQDIDS